MDKVYLLIEGMIWEGGVTTGVYKSMESAKAAALKVIEEYNKAIDDDEFYEVLPLTPKVVDGGLSWSTASDAYVEVVEVDLL